MYINFLMCIIFSMQNFAIPSQCITRELYAQSQLLSVELTNMRWHELIVAFSCIVNNKQYEILYTCLLSVVAKYFGQGLSFICYFTAVQEKLLAVFPVNFKVNLPAVNKVLILTIISFHKKPTVTDRNSVTTMNNVIHFYMYCLFLSHDLKS